MDLLTDPHRELRIKQFKKLVCDVYYTCVGYYGGSKYQIGFPELIFNYNGEDAIHGGEFCFENNQIEVNYQGYDDSVECFDYYTRLITHEYMHYLQSPTWFKRYYKMGHDYLTHPYEVEAYRRETELIELNLIQPTK